jgi:hypothetical protein
MERMRIADNKPPQDLTQTNITSILRIAGHYALNELKQSHTMHSFCACFSELCEALEVGYFQESYRKEVGEKRKLSSTLPILFQDCDIS